MSDLDLNRLKKNKEAILKAEIVSMLTLWDKLEPYELKNGDIKKEINYKYPLHLNIKKLNDWQQILNGLNDKRIIFKDLNDNGSKSFDIWNDFLNEWREWRKQDYLLKSFYGISESLNSGIDKGSPKENVKVQSEDERWIANAFGSFKRKIIYLEKEEDEINNIINEIKNKVLCVLDKPNISFDDLKEVRNKIKELLSGLLSDDRFPINDVSLWEQTFMPTSMFKALLSNYVLTHLDFDKVPDKQNIKWRILGIQYDKMVLAEKGFKLASIKWYRGITEKIDEKIKKLFEVEYPLGNEVYRDETGIYFIVGEDISELPTEIKNRILEIFKNTKLDESREIEGLKGETKFYIAISKASRGLMNLSTLIGNAKENFLQINNELIKFKRQELENYSIKKKALEIEELKNSAIDKNTNFLIKKGNEEIPKNCKDENGKETNFSIGVCPICQERLIFKSDKCKNNSPTICEVCDKRIHPGQVFSWIKDIKKETIWTDEIKDKNNSIAYISIKFELEDWLSGNLLNSLLGNKGIENFKKEKRKMAELLLKGYIKCEIEKILKNIKDEVQYSELKNISYFLHEKELGKRFNEIKDDIKNLSKDEKRTYGRLIGVLSSIINKIDNFNNLLELENNMENLKTIKEQFKFAKKFLEANFYDKYKNIFEILKNIKEKLNNTSVLLKNYINYRNSMNAFNEEYIDNVIKEFDELFKPLPDPSQVQIKKKELEYLIKENLYPFSINEELLNFYFRYSSIRKYFEEIFFSSIVGSKWEDWIKQTSLNSKINWEEEKIEWDKFTDENDQALDLLASLLLQFLLRKNPSPARLRRIWETTEGFFDNIHKNLDNLLEIPEWRKKRLVWEVPYTDKIKETGEELEGNGLLFWAQLNENKSKIKVYLITSIKDFIEKFGNEDLLKELEKNDENINLNFIKQQLDGLEIPLKRYSESKGKGEGDVLIKLTNNDLSEIHYYKPYSLITDISPINYQVIIPAEYLPKLIDEVLKRYHQEFKYVYGKLPIHIGIVVSDYKKPVYMNLKALRKIRRDVRDTEKLWINEDTGKFCQLQKEKLGLASSEEKINDIENYYSLYFNNLTQKDYHFYIKPDNNWKYWLSTFDKFPPNSKVKIIPNTFDFEFMDTNTRRNDIFYDEEKGYKRALKIKSNRPYELEIYWEKFKKFRELFSEKTNPVKMHKLVSLFYEKLQNYDERYKPLLASAIINILELKRDDNAKKIISQIFDLDESSSDVQKELSEKLNEEKLKLFIDMFEFWHTALKEV